MPCRAFRSIEERDRICAREAGMIRKNVERIDFAEIKAALEGYQNYVKELGEKNPRMAGKY